jgi:Spy/CpxP family protein refolding chaperone
MSKHRSGIAALMFSAALMCAPMGFAQSDNAQSSSSTSGQAQSGDQMGHKGRHGKRGGHMDKMMEQLNLTDAQKSQVKQLHQDGRAQMKQVESDSSLSAAQKKDKMKQLHQDQMSKMEALLTPDQKTKWEQMKSERKEKRGMHKHDKNSSKSSDTTKQQ